MKTKVLCINCNKIYERDKEQETNQTSNIHSCPFCGSEYYRRMLYEERIKI